MISLKTLPQATAQEVFDQVVNHARKQNAPSKADGGCFYRNPYNAFKCFAGCLISDAEYTRDMDEPDEGNSSWESMVERKIAPGTHFDLIKSLQCIHDEFPVDQWEDQFAMLAQYENLQYKEPLNG